MELLFGDKNCDFIPPNGDPVTLDEVKKLKAGDLMVRGFASQSGPPIPSSWKLLKPDTVIIRFPMDGAIEFSRNPAFLAACLERANSKP